MEETPASYEYIAYPVDVSLNPSDDMADMNKVVLVAMSLVEYLSEMCSGY